MCFEREVVLELLWAAREEIAWLGNEMRRLELHMENAKVLVASGERTSFVYVPSRREGMEVSGRYLKILRSGSKSEDEEEEMLLTEEGLERMGRMTPVDSRAGSDEGDVEMGEAGVEEGEVRQAETRRDSGASTDQWEERMKD